MSDFSDFCSMLREKSGMTIYHIAKAAGMERTALNRMLIGKRFPKYEDVELFCEVLRASEKEKEYLRELYLMEKMGRKKYENYHYVQKLICDLGQGVIHAGMVCPASGYNGGTPGQSFASGRNEVRERLCYMLEQAYRQESATEMYTNFPVHEDMLPIVISNCEEKYKRGIPLCHYHILNVNPEEYYDADCNLKVLYFSLMWRFSGNIRYIPYYTYSQLMLNDLELQFMPYYLVTDCQVLLVSNDFRQGILLDDPDTVLFYQDRMVHMRSQMYKLFHEDTGISGGKAGEPGDWEKENELLYSLDDINVKQKHLEVKLYEKGVVITKEDGGSCCSAIIKESSLYESFYDYFSYEESVKKSCTPERTY